MTLPALSIWPTLTELAACLCTQLHDSGLPDVCFCGVLPGSEVAWDYASGCDNCGMAWVRLLGMQPSTAFPQADINPSNCSKPLAYTVEMGVLRCAPMPKEDGTPPTLEEMLDATELQIADAAAMRRAVACCLGVRGWILGPYQPVGPQGGAVGGLWTVNIPEE